MTLDAPGATGPATRSATAVVRRAVREALRTVPAGPVLVAVSGGADSMALLAATLAEVAAPGGGGGHLVGAVSVDHGLQPGSAERGAAVAAIAKSLGADPVEVVRVEVGSEGGPEAAARTARYAALTAAADRYDAAAVLLGHTLDDQAETVLLGLARGSGARSLAGMSPHDRRWVRPLLGVRRAQTRAACGELDVPVWDDPHNDDPGFTRVRVRNHALPALTEALGAGVPEALARTAELLRADADALDAFAEQALVDARGTDGLRDTDNTDGTDSTYGLEVATLAGLPTAVRTRVLRRALIDWGAPAGRLTAAHVRSVDRLVTDWTGQGAVALPGLVQVRREYGRLRSSGGSDAAGVAAPADRRDA